MLIKYRIFEVVVLIVALTMVCLFLHGCHSPFMGENTFVASPSYVVDGSRYVKISEVKLDSVGHLMWVGKDKWHSKVDKDDLQSLCEQGKILTTSEFASNITGYYNTLVSVLVGLFVLFSVFGYLALNEKFKKELEEKENELENRLVQTVKDKLSDSVILQNAIVEKLRSDVEDLMMTKDDAFSIKADMETIRKDINSLYELNEELYITITA